VKAQKVRQFPGGFGGMSNILLADSGPDTGHNVIIGYDPVEQRAAILHTDEQAQAFMAGLNHSRSLTVRRGYTIDDAQAVVHWLNTRADAIGGLP
jgi:hypothetical protein